MAGTVEGGKAAGATNKSKYGADYYSKIGQMGAKAYRKRQKEGIAKPRGFAAMDKEKISAAGRKGGSISRRLK